MFLRKLHNIPDKVKWLSLELLVVFVGVYLAFLFQNYSEKQQIDKEREKVLVSLKKELEQFRMDFPGNADYQRNVIKEWDSIRNEGGMPAFYGWRYLEPQYNFKVIEYAINLQGTDILDFEVYEKLLNLYGGISKVQNAERVMTDFAGKYKNIPSDIAETEQVKLLRAENALNFFKFRVGASDRAGNLERVGKMAAELVADINERLGPEKTKEVDLALLEYYMDVVGDTTYIIDTFSEYFPEYTEDFVRQKISEFNQK